MDPLLKLLRENAAFRPDQLAKLLQLDESEIIARIREYEAKGTIVGYRTIINDEKIKHEPFVPSSRSRSHLSEREASITWLHALPSTVR
jgi:DNA-binding Lrp family transcriptional regulator